MSGFSQPLQLGTFTPVLNFGGATTGIAYTSQAGRWSRQGNKVQVQIYIILSSKGSAVGAATITGLPFTSNPSVPVGSASPALGATASITGPPRAILSQNSAIIQLEQLVSNAGVALTDANFTATSVIVLTLDYYV